ncbi:MAG: hypothetical protein KJ067_02690 [Vicinamibacteria bacterium]|nr:hypothetical protein [Vicinamibacteria bacterium]
MAASPRTQSRRAALRAAAALPLLAAVPAAAEEYADATAVLAAIDRLEAEVAARLRTVAAASPAAAALSASLLGDQAAFRAERSRLRRRLGLAPAPDAFAAPEGIDADLPALRAALDRLVYAHAEGLPAVDDPHAVQRLAAHMVECARHLTVIDLWLEAERG